MPNKRETHDSAPPTPALPLPRLRRRLPAWLPLFDAPDGVLLLHHMSQSHPALTLATPRPRDRRAQGRRSEPRATLARHGSPGLGYLVAFGEGANNPASAPTAAEPRAIRMVGTSLAVGTSASAMEPPAPVSITKPSTMTTIR